MTFRQFVSFNSLYDFYVMGILNKLFGSAEAKVEKTLPWIALSSIEQLDDIQEKSKTKTQVIFKHSTTCGISKMVINRFEAAYNLPENNLDLYYLDLHSYRAVSNEITSKFQVIHESPQLLVIKNGVTVAHASHGAMNEVDLKRFL